MWLVPLGRRELSLRADRMGAEAARQPETTETVLPWWEQRWFLALVVLSTMIPLIYPPVPPLVDLFGHMGRYRVELDLATSPYLQRYYDYHWAAIGNLGRHDGTNDGQCDLFFIRSAVLLSTKKDITGDRPLDARQKSALLGEVGDADAAFAAESKYGWRAGNTPPADQPLYGVDGKTQAGFILNFNCNGFPVAVEIGSLRGDVQCVEQLSHGESRGKLKGLALEPAPPYSEAIICSRLIQTMASRRF